MAGAIQRVSLVKRGLDLHLSHCWKNASVCSMTMDRGRLLSNLHTRTQPQENLSALSLSKYGGVGPSLWTALRNSSQISCSYSVLTHIKRCIHTSRCESVYTLLLCINRPSFHLKSRSLMYARKIMYDATRFQSCFFLCATIYLVALRHGEYEWQDPKSPEDVYVHLIYSLIALLKLMD